jgi:chaperonin cofactor prefoldin
MIHMTNSIIRTLERESEDLKLHVDLCAQRYSQLIDRFEVVENRLDRIDTNLVELKTIIENRSTHNYETYLKWGGAIIFVLSTALVGIITKLLTQ